jgi:hypothetical protein
MSNSQNPHNRRRKPGDRDEMRRMGMTPGTDVWGTAGDVWGTAGPRESPITMTDLEVLVRNAVETDIEAAKS